MIYGLVNQDTTNAQRLVIAQAIQSSDALVFKQHAENGTIIHIMDTPTDVGFSCFFCRIPVFPTDARPPRGLEANSTWHFEHHRTGRLPGECVGHVRLPPIPYALGVENLAQHGCYIRLGCEINANGNPTDWHRTNCKTIVQGLTYCHHARRNGCV
jgi:hypothetical protein